MWCMLQCRKAGASISSIAKQADCSRSVVSRILKKQASGKPIEDAPKPGRPSAFKEEQLQKLKDMAISSTSKEIAAQSSSVFNKHISSRTVCRTLKKSGMKYGKPMKVLPLNAAKKAARLKFAQHHIAQKTDFKKIMFTDSKMFCLGKDDGMCWYPDGERPTVEVEKFSKKIHIYMGVTAFGPTVPILVSGGTKKSEFEGAKGVGANEYEQTVLVHFKEEGMRLFGEHRLYKDKWVFQQDNARAHTALTSKSFLDIFFGEGRWIDNWPASSPDLSWIENIWAWAEKKLSRRRHEIKTIEQLESVVKEILTSLTAQQCMKYVDGMMKRMKEVVKVKGSQIGK